MSRRVFLTIVVGLALAAFAFAACGSEDEGQVTEPVPVIEPTRAPEPAAVSEPEPTVVMSGGLDLSAECLGGGALTDVNAVISCNRQAMDGFTSFSFDGSFDLMAAFPVPGAPPGGASIKLNGGMVKPDKTSFTLTLGPEGQTIETSGILIGDDFYTQDPASRLWFKAVSQDEQSLAPLQLVSMLFLPQDVPTTLNGVIDLDEGGKAYVLLSDQADLGEEAAMFGLDESGITRLVGVDDFLTKEVRVTVQGTDGETRDLFSVRYHGFGEDLSIEAPESFVELPPDALSGGVQEPATVLGLARNAEGHVEVQFSKPVFVEGEVVLYVLEPSTGGWELPLLSGSGTDTLVFDAAAEGKPTLVAGEHEIAFIGFGNDAQIVGADGVQANDLFDTWTYE
ncbi:MAG: hypothetical protein OXC99_12630 [Chloroflexi bacterium]|nr:hypothetical protein [Chloroflexota bacterium]